MAEHTHWYGGFLGQLSPRVQGKLVSLGEAFHYTAGQTIFREGDHSTHLYIVKAGRVSLATHVPSKGRRPIMDVGSGELFSWSALVAPYVETASARATEQTELLGIKGSALMDLCRQDRELGFEIYRALAEIITARLIATRLQLVDIFAVAKEAGSA